MAKSTLEYFDDVLKIPRPSGQETLMRNNLIDRGKEFGYEYKIDHQGNLVIYVPGTEDQKDSETVVLQAHMDMVCVKTEGSTHDFTKDAIRKVIEGDWMYADNTTLGADNGIGIAMIQAATHLPSHPPLELLFTVDEEVGLTGAINLDASLLTGKTVINLDTEVLGEICISSAGGARVNVSQNFETDTATYEQNIITIKEMRGGHSGTEIHENRGNAIRLLLTIIKNAKEELGIEDMEVANIQGGQAFNAIPGSCSITIGTTNNELFLETIKKHYDLLIQNYDAPKAELVIDKPSNPTNTYLLGFDSFSDKILSQANGVINMSEKIDGLVETSINLGMISVKDNNVALTFLPRSSIPAKLDIELATLQDRFGPENIEIKSKYYGREQDPNSELVQAMNTVYTKVYGKAPKIISIHAGLECGAIAGKLGEGSQAVSIGPTITDPHSPKERVNIPSVIIAEKVLFELLSQTAAK